MKASFFAAGLFVAGVLADNTPNVAPPGKSWSCKCFPGDACWPSEREWNALNRTVGGRLIATVPLAQACHDPNFDPVRCEALRKDWQNPTLQ